MDAAASPPPTIVDQLIQGWRGYALVALIALVSAFFGVAKLPVMDRDEARYAQATRQMVESGDYVRIRVQEVDRNKKPIGIHWLQAAAVNAAAPLTPRDNTIWPYRIPSMLGAALAALAALWAGTALIGRTPAVLGAGLLASSMLLGFEGMTAKTDAVLLGFTTLALAALAHFRVGTKRPRVIALVFWFALGCGVLIKGPVTPMVVVLTLGALALWERRWEWMKPLLFWAGPLLAALIIAPWAIAISEATGGHFFLQAFIEDIAPKMAGGSEGHFWPPGMHLLLLPVLIFPAAYALPVAARLGWRAARAPASDEQFASLRFLLAWIVPAFVLFELMPTKLVHYTLPTYPAIALLCGAGLVTAFDEKWALTRRLGLVLFTLAGAALVALLAYGATFMPGDPESDMRRAATLALVGGVIVAAAFVALFVMRDAAYRAGVLVLCALSLSYALRAHVLPEARTVLVSSEALAALQRARLTPRSDRPLWVVGYRETSLVFMTDTSIRLVDPIELGAGVHVGDALLIEQRDALAVRNALTERGFAFAANGPPVAGLNVGNGKRVTLYVGTAQVAPPAIQFNDELAGDPPPDPEPQPRRRRRDRR